MLLKCPRGCLSSSSRRSRPSHQGAHSDGRVIHRLTAKSKVLPKHKKKKRFYFLGGGITIIMIEALIEAFSCLMLFVTGDSW